MRSAVAGAGCDVRRNGHSADGGTDAAGDRSSVMPRRGGLRRARSKTFRPGLRTDYLFRMANQRGGIVLGTGDLSELALGWSTYGVGDQMSHYNVNAGVPEDVDPAPDPLGHLVRTSSSREVCEVLESVLDTEITPELIPTEEGEELQSSEAQGRAVLRCRTSRCSTCCATASGRRRSRSWPGMRAATRSVATGRPAFPADKRPSYSLKEIRHWLQIFVRAVLLVQPVQAVGDAERAPRCAPVDRCRRAEIGARRRTCPRGSGWTRSSAKSPRTDGPRGEFS